MTADVQYCWCTRYVGPTGWCVHPVGKVGVLPDRNCAHWKGPEDKDTLMRVHVRESFVRVSEGLIDIACLNGDVPLVECTRRVSVCDHNEQSFVLLDQREALFRMVEELLEKDDPDVDRVYYYRKIQEMRYAVRSGAPREKGARAGSPRHEGNDRGSAKRH